MTKEQRKDNLQDLEPLSLVYGSTLIPINKFTGELDLEVTYSGQVNLLLIDDYKDNPRYQLGLVDLTDQQKESMRERFIMETGDFESEPYYFQPIKLTPDYILHGKVDLMTQVSEIQCFLSEPFSAIVE